MRSRSRRTSRWSQHSRCQPSRRRTSRRAWGPPRSWRRTVRDATDYSVAPDDTIVVAATESLGRLRGLADVSPRACATLNHVRGAGRVRIGRKPEARFQRIARTSSSKHAAATIIAQLQAGYFASHRISGTQVYVVRAGDSLWSLTQRFGALPVWLLQQYNPDVEFDALKAGTQIVLPRVEDLGNAGADN